MNYVVYTVSHSFPLLLGCPHSNPATGQHKNCSLHIHEGLCHSLQSSILCFWPHSGYHHLYERSHAQRDAVICITYIQSHLNSPLGSHSAHHRRVRVHACVHTHTHTRSSRRGPAPASISLSHPRLPSRSHAPTLPGRQSHQLQRR